MPLVMMRRAPRVDNRANACRNPPPTVKQVLLEIGNTPRNRVVMQQLVNYVYCGNKQGRESRCACASVTS